MPRAVRVGLTVHCDSQTGLDHATFTETAGSQRHGEIGIGRKAEEATAAHLDWGYCAVRRGDARGTIYTPFIEPGATPFPNKNHLNAFGFQFAAGRAIVS